MVLPSVLSASRNGSSIISNFSLTLSPQLKFEQSETMVSLTNSFVPARNSQPQFLSGSSLMQADRCLSSTNLLIFPRGTTKSLKNGKPLIVRAGGDGGRSSGAGLFVGGFLLGGIVVGTLGCVYAPQISKALTGEDRKELMRKLPKFIYDEEKALEKTRQVLTEKIAQLNAAIDDVSFQLRKDNPQNKAPTSSDEQEATV